MIHDLFDDREIKLSKLYKVLGVMQKCSCLEKWAKDFHPSVNWLAINNFNCI